MDSDVMLEIKAETLYILRQLDPRSLERAAL